MFSEKEYLAVKHTLRFREDGKFRILFITDIHEISELTARAAAAGFEGGRRSSIKGISVYRVILFTAGI